MEGQKVCRKHYPSDLYQKEYRKSHPVYAKRNREQQASRNKKRQKEFVPIILKVQSLLLQPREDGLYLINR